ncbi:unnamed protein product [Aphis gossypii]|uniref:Uncharacterized protein n=1 Tax=Aphis gossypii TaxID=80765 RepID=A0A9P0NS09_APHGO|nr:unnamed protein product [Aphis gossypii]
MDGRRNPRGFYNSHKSAKKQQKKTPSGKLILRRRQSRSFSISLIRDTRTVRRNAAAAVGTKPRFFTGRFRIVSVVGEYGFGRPTYRVAHAHSRTTTTPTLQYYNIFFFILLRYYYIYYTRKYIYVHCARNEPHRWR